MDLEGLAGFLRERHALKTATHVAAETGLPADTVKKWLAGESAPNGRALIVLACHYGPEALAAMLTELPPWLDASTRQVRRGRLERELASLEAQLDRPAAAAASGEFAGAAA